MSDSEQCSNRLELYLISLLVNFSCELGQIMTRYDFLWARWVFWAMFEPTWTWPNFTFYVNWDKYRISPYISREIYPRTKYYTDNSSYTQVTPSGKKLYRKQVEFSKFGQHHDSAVVSDNAQIYEFSIAPLVYHLYTNPFLCYSWDIIL